MSSFLVLSKVTNEGYACVSYYCCILMNFNTVNTFQTIAVVTLIDAQIIPSLANGSIFTLAPVSFLHDPVVSYSILHAGMIPASLVI